MNWKPFSLHFKQQFEGGYRYLDKCGDFLLAAEQDLGFLLDDATPSGAKISIPEEGISAAADTRKITVFQEFCSDDGQGFLSVCQKLSTLYQEIFAPRTIESTGFASKSVCSFDSAADALKTSLRLGDPFHEQLARMIEMPALEKRLDMHFSAGSSDLHVLLHPLTCQSIPVQQRNEGPRLTKSEMRRIERLNRRTEKVNPRLSHVMMLELDLIEFDPPPNSLGQHFENLKKKERILRKQFKIS